MEVMQDPFETDLQVPTMCITSSPSKDPETDHPLPELSVPLNCEPKDDISLPDSEDGWRSLLSCNCEAVDPVTE